MSLTIERRGGERGTFSGWFGIKKLNSSAVPFMVSVCKVRVSGPTLKIFEIQENGFWHHKILAWGDKRLHKNKHRSQLTCYVQVDSRVT